MKRLIQPLILAGLLGLGSAARAEGGCPPGMTPFQFAPNQPPSCAPGPNSSAANQAPQQLTEIWKDRWGALAADGIRGTLGVATGMADPKSAKNAALLDCKAKGGIDCDVSTPFRNGCQALIVNAATYHFSTDVTEEKANSSGVAACQSRGLKNCRVYYTTCSPPIRIQ